MQLFYEGKKDRCDILNMPYAYSFSKHWDSTCDLLIEGENFSSMQVLLHEYSLRGRLT